MQHLSLGPVRDQQLFFDPNLQELITVTVRPEISNRLILTRNGFEGISAGPEYEVPNTGRIQNLGFSPSLMYVALQRRNDSLEIIHLETGSTFPLPINTRDSNAQFLGFRWTTSSNLLIVCTDLFEYYSITWKPDTNTATIKSVKRYKLKINWFVYSSSIRILLLSTTERSSVLQPFYFGPKSGPPGKLPKFDVHTKSDNSPLLERDISLSQIYNGIFCIHANLPRNELILWQISKDGANARLAIDLHTQGQVYTSVIDNVLITHNIEQQFPIAAPLPLGLLTSSPEKHSNVSAQERVTQEQLTGPVADGEVGSKYIVPVVYGKDWKFILPRYIISETTGDAWQLDLNLESLTVSFSDRVRLVDFLLRRINAQDLLLRTLTLAIYEHEPLSSFMQIFDMINRVLASYITQSLSTESQKLQAAFKPETEMTYKKTVSFWKLFLKNTRERQRSPVANPQSPAHKKHASSSRTQTNSISSHLVPSAEEPSLRDSVTASVLDDENSSSIDLASSMDVAESRSGLVSSAPPSDFSLTISLVNETEEGERERIAVGVEEDVRLALDNDIESLEDERDLRERDESRRRASSASNSSPESSIQRPNSSPAVGSVNVATPSTPTKQVLSASHPPPTPSVGTDGGVEAVIPRVDGCSVISQQLFYTHVLLPVESSGRVSSDFLVAIVVEYIRTLNYQHINVRSYFYEFIIDHLVRQKQFYQLHQFIQYHVISDSVHVACQLLSLEKLYAPCSQLALDMLKRLNEHDQILEIMLAKGQIIPALRIFHKLRQNQQANVTLKPQRLLETARSSGCKHTFYHTYQSLNSAGLIDPATMATHIQLFKDLFEDPNIQKSFPATEYLGDESDTIDGGDSDSIFTTTHLDFLSLEIRWLYLALRREIIISNLT